MGTHKRLTTVLIFVIVYSYRAFTCLNQEGGELDRQKVNSAYAAMPLSFEPNQGQTSPNVKYLSHGRGYVLFLTQGEAVFVFRGQQKTPPSKAGNRVLRLKLMGAKGDSAVTAHGRLPGIVNYFRGEKRSQWRTQIPTYQSVLYRNVYSGIDLEYHGNQRNLEYDFIVQPGGDPNRIEVRFLGSSGMKIDPGGNLILEMLGGHLMFKRPIASQIINGSRRIIDIRYSRRSDNTIAFKLGQYERTQPLVIDPVLLYSTYLGGSSFTLFDGGEELEVPASDYGRAIAVDSTHHVYVAGETESSDFPTTSGAYDPSEFLSCHSHGCFTAAFLTKFSVDGSKVLYSTYLYNTGGLEDEESVSINGIAVDSAGNAFVTGTTYGGGFPTTASAFQNGDNLSPEAFLTKFNSTGSELLYSTVFGSEGGSAQGSAVALDGTGKAVIAGWTDDIDLPTTPGASQSLYGGGYQDAFVAKFDTTQSGVGSLVFCTYLGGDGQEQATGIVLDSSENSYVSGTTDSRTFPHGHSFGGTSTGGAFVTKLNPTGTGLIFSTLVGGASSGPYGALSSATVGIDSGRNAYLAGTASGSNFPVTTGVVQPKFGGGQTDGFLTKLNSSGSALIFSTYIGGSLDDAVAAMTVDSSGNPIIVGATSSPDFKTTLNAFQRVFGGHYDATVMKLNSAGTSRIYSSFLGGGGTDSALAVTVDKSNNVYVAGETNSLAFPTTQRAYQSSNRGAYDAFVSKLISLCALSSNMPSVTICSPKSEANIVSPVTIIAGTTDTHPVKLLQVYVDGSKRYEAKLSAIDLHLPMNTGSHRLTVQALDLSGVWFKKTIYITVP